MGAHRAITLRVWGGGGMRLRGRVTPPLSLSNTLPQRQARVAVSAPARLSLCARAQLPRVSGVAFLGWGPTKGPIGNSMIFFETLNTRKVENGQSFALILLFTNIRQVTASENNRHIVCTQAAVGAAVLCSVSSAVTAAVLQRASVHSAAAFSHRAIGGCMQTAVPRRPIAACWR